MNFSQLANPRILDQPIYQWGKPIEQVAQEYNLDSSNMQSASNENLGVHLPKQSMLEKKA